jgi:hypothetical protein
VKVLLICPWVVSLAPLRGLLPQVVRVDFEAALRVALVHDRFVAAIYTPTPSLSAGVVENAIREHAPRLPLHQVDHLDRVAELVTQLALDRQS